MIHLKFTNPYKETFWFVRLGEPWPHEPRFRLIAETTPDREKAASFATQEEAFQVLKDAGAPSGWAIESPSTPS